MWSLPLDHWHVYGVLWWVHWVIVEGAVVGRELRVSEKGIVIRADLDDLLNLVLDRVLLWLLLLRHVRLAHSAVIDHLVILLAHSIFVAHVLLCRKQLLILLLGHWLAIDIDKLLLPHLVLLLVDLLVVSLLLVRRHLVVSVLLVRGQLTEINHLLLLHLLLHMELHFLLAHLHLVHLLLVHAVWIHLHLHLVLVFHHLMLLHDLLLLRWQVAWAFSTEVILWHALLE